MNTAKQVDDLIAGLNKQVDNGEISRSYGMWQTGLACIGWSYVYSAWEALCTPAERRKRFKMCPDKLNIKAKCKAFDNGNCSGCQWFPDEERTRCGDCRGFQHCLFLMFGFDLEGDTVSSQWNSKKNWCVKGQFGVDPVPQNVYVSVFIKNKTTGKWTHTGGYFNGATIECASGVQYFNPMKKNRWTHWAIAKCFASNYEPPKEPEKQPEKEQTVSYKTIRKGNMGELVKQCQTMLQKLGYDLGICGVDGDFGTATEKAVRAFQKAHNLSVDGVVGKNTWAALEAAVNALQEAPAVVYYDVTIPHLTQGEADAVIAKYPNAKKEIEKG